MRHWPWSEARLSPRPSKRSENRCESSAASSSLVIAVIGLVRTKQPVDTGAMEPRAGDLARTYGRFVGLTVINPTTVVYFAAVVIGLGVARGMTAADGALFVTGAFLASLSWQTLIAAVGAFAGHRLSVRSRRVMTIVGNLVILALGIVILLD